MYVVERVWGMNTPEVFFHTPDLSEPVVSVSCHHGLPEHTLKNGGELMCEQQQLLRQY